MPALVSKKTTELMMFSACSVLSLLAASFLSTLFSLIFPILLLGSRLPLLLIAITAYGTLLQWLPEGSVCKKLALFMLMGIFGIWWTDLKFDGVRRGSVAQQPSWRLPHGGSIILSPATSPIDAVYLAATFDPVFTTSCPGTRKVCRLSLLQAVLRAFQPAGNHPHGDAALGELETILVEQPARAIVVFLDYPVAISKGIVPCLPSPVAVPAWANVFRVSIRHMPPDATTGDHGGYLLFLWNLLSRPLHLIRVHIADNVNATAAWPHSDKMNNEPTNLVTRYNRDGPSRRSRSRVTRRRITKRPLRVLAVIEE